MGYKVSTFLIVIMLFLSFFIPFTKIVNASENSNEEWFCNLFEEKFEDISYDDDVWLLKNFIDDLSLKNSVKEEFVPGEVIVKFKDEAPKGGKFELSRDRLSLGIPALDSLNEKHDLLDVEEVSLTDSSPVLKNVYKFSFPEDSDVDSIVKSYENDKNVEYAEPNYLFHILNTPDDPSFSYQWALNQSNDCDIDAPEAWNIETGDENIIIAIVDTGVDYNHSDLADNIWNNTAETVNGADDDGNGYIDDIRGWDFYNKDNNPTDDHGHGTHCSGIVSAVTNNSVGMAGICWNCTIMPIKIGGSYGIPTDAAANGITYAADNGADVISMSWGGYYSSTLISDAIDYAYGKGATLVAAAGNSDTDMKGYPAAYSKVIAVAATNSTDGKASFSNYGNWVDVAAPGVDIYSTMPTYSVYMNNFGYSQNYANCSGTSMAGPYVAGLAGLILSKNSTFTPDEVRTILESSTDTVTSDYYIGRGRINASSAISKDSIPIAIINSTLGDSGLTGVVNITGTANGSLFTNFSIYYGAGLYPTSWTLINSSSSMVNDSVLGQWNTTLVNDSTYALRLIVNDSSGSYGEDRLQVEVNNVVNTFYVGGGGANNYSSIQDAIDDANDGDAIFVYSGTYYEGLMISDNINLVGEDKNTTIIDGTYEVYCMWVDAGQCSIENFSIVNSLYGIVFTSSDTSIVQNNYINDTTCGIYLISNVGEYSVNMSNISGSNLINNRIENNTFNNSYYGIICQGNHTLACNNTIKGNSEMFGVLCWGDNNTIQYNNIMNQQYAIFGYGIYLYPGSPNNRIIGNTITESNTGIYVGEGSNHTVISGNTITNNQKGIYVYGPAETNGHVVNATYTDSFEDGDASDWSIQDLGGPGYTWDVESTLPYWAGLSYQDGTYFLMIDDDAAPLDSNNLDSAVTPLINCTSYTDVYLTFSIDFEDFVTYGRFWVNVSTNNGTAWTNVWNETDDNDTKVVLNISLIADGEEILVNFTYDDDDEWAWGALIDDMAVGSSYEYITTYDNLNTSINYNNIYNNTDYGLYYDSSATSSINATLNWWGDETGPYNSTTNSGGLGDNVDGPVNYQSWLLHTYPGVKNLDTGQTYSTIQDAINDSGDGNTITIYNGTYYENIVINRSITLQAGSSPTIDGMNDIGIIVEANNTIIKEINITNCSIGIKVYNDSFTVNNVTIFKNNIYNNSNGISLNDSSDNVVYHNNFINNNQQAYDNSSNTWYNATLLNGNYWDDFDESGEGAYDNNSNGIIDSAYNISAGSNQDEYPLVYQFENYYILSITADSQVDEENQFTVAVKSTGGTTMEEATVTFNSNEETTNSNGQATFAAPSVGSDTVYQITASKSGFTGDSTTITVKNVPPGNGNGYVPPSGDTTAPTAPTNVSCTTPETDNTPSFTWNASTDASGIAGYYVKIDDGEDTWIGNVITWTSTSAIADDTHTFYVKAKDSSTNSNIGSYGSCSFIINTTAAGDPPVADANGPYTGLTYQNITFDGSSSYDSDGTIENYTWDFGDGSTGYGVEPVHIYNTSGLFNVSLTITDNDDLSNTNTTTANIALDSDGDGWSDEMEMSYGTNITSPDDCPLDIDGDGIPDEDSDDWRFSGDPDDDNDGIEDHIEETLGLDPKNGSDAISITIAGTTHYLIDTNGDGKSDKFYNSVGRITLLYTTDDGMQLIDVDGDNEWDYIYNPASNEVTPYGEKSPGEFPWLLVIMGAVVAIVAIIIILFFTGYIRIEEED